MKMETKVMKSDPLEPVEEGNEESLKQSTEEVRQAHPATSFVGDTDDSSQEGADSSEAYRSEIGDDSMPLFNYNRLFGSLPRATKLTSQSSKTPEVPSVLSVQCTCSTMGQLRVTTETMSQDIPDSSPANATATEGTPVSFDLWQRQIISLSAFGFADGQVLLVDASNGLSVLTSTNHLVVRDGPKKESIVALSFDASGTFLAALDSGGMCCIWELKYSIQMRRVSAARSATTSQQSSNLFGSIMSAFTGGVNNVANSVRVEDDTDHQREGAENVEDELIPALTIASIQSNRVSYPMSFGRPTCVALDPTYRRKREKALVVGFEDGKLVWTKRGFVFQRRNDAVIYQAVKEEDKYFQGIEAVSWRGSFIAFADCSGIRLLDAEQMSRIAHIDRPAGARPTLYPSVAHLRPSLCFETSHQLLVVWGDCLLSLVIREYSGRNATADHLPPGPSTTGSEVQLAGGGTGGGARPVATNRRTVECSMAWELDCVACSVVPIDSDNVAVLGLVVPVDENGGPTPDKSGNYVNDVELQVISRSTGSVIYADLLPLLRNNISSRGASRAGKAVPESLLGYNLLSSFSVPRMENTSELAEEGPEESDEFIPMQTAIFAPPGTKRPFRDLHRRWKIGFSLFEDLSDLGRFGIKENDAAAKDGSDGEGSVDSDDYDFILKSQAVVSDSESSINRGEPPLMTIASPLDIVSIRVRTVDDAIAFALDEGKPASALRRALLHVRSLRRFEIKDLVDEYFASVLRLPRESPAVAGDKTKDDGKHLSLRRMKLAAEAMPILLGASVNQWERWLLELEKIPGALYVARSHLPVRDPKLPKSVYVRLLHRMLVQSEEMANDSSVNERLIREAEGHFISAIVSWGSTDGITELIKLHSAQADVDPKASSAIRSMEESLRYRNQQTSAVYLSSDETHLVEREAQPASDHILQSIEPQAALYPIEEVLEFVHRRLPILSSESRTIDIPKDEQHLVNRKLVLESAAKLYIMKGRFDQALKCFLIIGALHPSFSLEIIEEHALRTTNSNVYTSKSHENPHFSYVLLMIENHHLHQYLLDVSFTPELLDCPPLFALSQLVGLDLVRDFLVKHCVAPEQTIQPTTMDVVSPSSRFRVDKTGGERRGTLPLDLVARQLDANPKLLHWYLHLVFVSKPELYVQFPHTAIPSAVITSLHRKHLDLYIRYAGANKDSVIAMAGVEAYRVLEFQTPLLAFLKAVLKLGGIKPLEIGRLLGVERKGGAGVSHIFALELGYIMEHYGDGSESDTILVLELYLKGTQSLMLAVSYAQRAKEYSAKLWEILIDHCLKTNEGHDVRMGGQLFGSLLEAAALSGADLAHLVAQIPTGMAIEGLRPRLVAAVADYRLKLQMHESTSKVGAEEKIGLLREVHHRSKRGVRYEYTRGELYFAQISIASGKLSHDAEKEVKLDIGFESQPLKLRPVARRDRHSLSLTLPIR